MSQFVVRRERKLIEATVVLDRRKNCACDDVGDQVEGDLDSDLMFRMSSRKEAKIESEMRWRFGGS